MKLEIRENSTAQVLRFNTFKSGDEQINFEGYVDRMKEGQNDICYIIGESIAVVSSSSFLENLRKAGHEVLRVIDPVDEYAVHKPKLRPTMEEGLDLGEKLKTESEPLKKLMKEVLGDKVEEESQGAVMYGDGGNGVGASKAVDVAARGQVDVERVRQHTGAAVWQRQPHSSKQQPTRKKRGQVERGKGQGERESGKKEERGRNKKRRRKRLGRKKRKLRKEEMNRSKRT